jgi:pimeloyl-ACP methyl ester carboxylesterase
MQCQIEQLSVYYDIVGEGHPLLMLHGWPLDHRHMRAEMEPLFEGRSGWKRIYMDLPGMGQTPGTDAITTQDQMLQVVISFVDRIIPGQHFSVAGLSYGGYLARGLIYCRPELIDGVLMTVPAILMDHARRVLPELTVIHEDEQLMAEIEPDLAESMRSMVVAQTREVADHWRATIRPAVQAADQAFLGRIQQPYQFSHESKLDTVPFDKPALIITGRQDNVCGYLQAWDLAQRFPRATFAMLDRAGHSLSSEQPELFRALVKEWLDRVDESRGS